MGDDITKNMPMTIGDYLIYLTDAISKEPDLSAVSLYSHNGILFGWEDEEDTAKRFGVSVEQIRVWVNDGYLEGVRSNDHLIIPVTSTKPTYSPMLNFMEGFEDDYSGLIEDE